MATVIVLPYFQAFQRRFRDSRNPKFSGGEHAPGPLEISRLWRSHTTHQSDFFLDPPLLVYLQLLFQYSSQYICSCYISTVVSIFVVVISVQQLVYLQLLYQYSSQYICNCYISTVVSIPVVVISVQQLVYLQLLYQQSSQYTCSCYISTVLVYLQLLYQYIIVSIPVVVILVQCSWYICS